MLSPCNAPRTAVLAWLLTLGAAVAVAQPPGDPTQQICPNTGQKGPMTVGRKLLGLTPVELDCTTCHSQGVGKPWVLGTEHTIWDQQGRHRQAYLTLRGERAQRMGEVLGVAAIEHDARCLTCHATLPVEWMAEEAQAAQTVAALLEDDRARSLIVDGVSCEACHGASGPVGDLPGWVNQHITWRVKGPDEKQAFGFYDVRSPVSRTKMCASCHVGDAERGRVVTHEMYAAGHPPLPAFEVETFLRDMPPHWRILNSGRPADTRDDGYEEKTARVTADFLVKTNEKYLSRLVGRGQGDPDRALGQYRRTFDRTRALAIGAMVTWGQNARLTASLASTERFPLSNPAGHWPELAAFECAACHHDLRSDGWRARRSPKTTPGRPTLQHWSSPLFDAVCAALMGDRVPESIRSIESFLDRATRDQPFGDRGEIASKLSGAATAADRAAANLQQRPLRAPMAGAMLLNIAATGEATLLDYESARHMAWGYDTVLRELDPRREWSELDTLVNQAKAMLEPPEKWIERNVTDPTGASRAVRLVDLPGELDRAAAYDALAMQRFFKRLREATDRRLGPE